MVVPENEVQVGRVAVEGGDGAKVEVPVVVEVERLRKFVQAVLTEVELELVAVIGVGCGVLLQFADGQVVGVLGRGRRVGRARHIGEDGEVVLHSHVGVEDVGVLGRVLEAHIGADAEAGQFENQRPVQPVVHSCVHLFAEVEQNLVDVLHKVGLSQVELLLQRVRDHALLEELQLQLRGQRLDLGLVKSHAQLVRLVGGEEHAERDGGVVDAELAGHVLLEVHEDVIAARHQREIEHQRGVGQEGDQLLVGLLVRKAGKLLVVGGVYQVDLREADVE